MQAPNKAGNADVTAHPVHGAGERTSNINKVKTAAPKAATAQQAFIMTARIMARSFGDIGFDPKGGDQRVAIFQDF
ncbi:hypothetical protein GCM10017620_03240 [Brevundimonas intermedia]|uniref:Uncharacterized protein n=1 Tax=Brevundimonas intermedia TaxID=74315 RepID=A0ABQ5T6E2_9CAUL|nr:hypothetical protein GCM10017620_03240 [Brevundimonas intermedia]